MARKVSLDDDRPPASKWKEGTGEQVTGGQADVPGEGIGLTLAGTVPRLTRAQAAIIGAYTGITCGPFNDIHEYAERIMGRPIWTHQFADQKLADEIKEKARPDFMAIVSESGS